MVARQGSSLFVRLGPWLAAVFGGLIVFVIVMYILRWIAVSKSGKRSSGFTMEEIEHLHHNGTLSDEEYRLARRAALGLTGRKLPADEDERTDEDGAV